jgi:hypothetical protein
MTNSSTRIKLRLSITLSKDDLGLIRIYNELAAIECDATLPSAEISETKRRHLLGILYQYCYTPLPNFPGSLSAVLSVVPVIKNKSDVTEETSRTPEMAPVIQVTPALTTTYKKSALAEMNAASQKALSEIGVGFITTNPNP